MVKSENSGENFFCQHGPAECTGNRLQSCVLDILNDDQDAKAKFVTCQMKWNAEYTGRKVCGAVFFSVMWNFILDIFLHSNIDLNNVVCRFSECFLSGCIKMLEWSERC